MPEFHLKADHPETYQLVDDIFARTRILRRELELELGRWRFVVFGPDAKEGTVLREGCAVHLRVDDGLVYVAAMGNPDQVGKRGMPIEEFAHGDIPEELRGLEIFHVDPVRPLQILDKRRLPASPDVGMTILEEFEEKNIAVIESPDERYWSLSVLKYLWECDRFFPDVLTEALKKGRLPLRAC